MTLQLQTKSKTRSKYRPVERADGVVVLHRPYRPATSPPPQAAKFEKHVPTFVVPAPSTKPKPKQKIVLGKVEASFAQVAAHVPGTGKDGLSEAGYDDLCQGREELLGFLDGLRLLREEGQMAPMQRFLSEAGPWSPVEMRQS
jgi:hypothetical protein